jgi:8-oxo-dGTP diphosphatase
MEKRIPKYYYKYSDGKEYPAILVAADAVVCKPAHENTTIQYHTLLIKRKDDGRWACPGGFVDYNECFMDASIRECKEETGIILDYSQCKGSRMFDDPNRGGECADRGRIISMAYYYQVPWNTPTPKGNDDAAEARWFTGKEMEDLPFHGDHKLIVLSGHPYNRYSTEIISAKGQ